MYVFPLGFLEEQRISRYLSWQAGEPGSHVPPKAVRDILYINMGDLGQDDCNWV